MDTRHLHKPSTQTVGISALLVSLLGLIAGAWYYREQNATSTQRLKRRANRQIKRARGHLNNGDHHITPSTGLAIGALGLAAALLVGGSEAYRRTHNNG